MLVTRKFEFDASHQLEKLGGKEKNLHGHRYVLEITVSGRVKDGVVIDIAEIKEIVKNEIIEKFDHNHLNNIVDNPTMENITLRIWNILKEKLKSLYEIKLYETPNNYVTYRGD